MRKDGDAAVPKPELEPSTFRLRAGCLASTWTALIGPALLTWAGASGQTEPDGGSRIVWMFIWMIKRLPMKIGWHVPGASW